MPEVMQGVAPGWVTIGDPLILGTLGRDAAFGLLGLTAPGIAGCVVEGADPADGVPDPIPLVPDGEGTEGATLGEGAPPGWVGAVPVPDGELVVCPWAGAASSRARPAAARILARIVMFSLAEKVALLDQRGSEMRCSRASGSIRALASC